MKKQPLFVAFSNQKGGVGKSAFTILMASYFHYLKDKNVLVVDCDFPQHSTYGVRERDKKLVPKSDRYKRMIVDQFERTQKKAYTILKATAQNAKQVAEEFLTGSDTEYDLVLLDLPGTVNTPGYFTTVFNLDYVFMPIITDRMILQSSLSFATTAIDYLENNKDNVQLKGFYLFWNAFDKRVSTEVYTSSTKVIEHLNLKVMDTIIPNSYRYCRELSITGAPFFRCTLFSPMPKLLKDSMLEEFAAEFATLINL